MTNQKTTTENHKATGWYKALRPTTLAPLTGCYVCGASRHTYNHRACVHCAARLVIDARPSRQEQNKVLAMTDQNHDRDEVLRLVKSCVG